jgi:hypothetical protein
MEAGMGFLGDWGLQAGLQGGLKDVLEVLPWSLDARPCGDGQVEMVPKRICCGCRDFNNHFFSMLNLTSPRATMLLTICFEHKFPTTIFIPFLVTMETAPKHGHHFNTIFIQFYGPQNGITIV